MFLILPHGGAKVAVNSEKDAIPRLQQTPCFREDSEGARGRYTHVQRNCAESAPPTVAALYVQRSGCYFGLSGVDPWDEARDARTYAGPWPVVAHPPCARWSMLAGLVEHVYGHKRGDDGGCFGAALDAVRRWGGVLEHPAESAAWRAHGLMTPPSDGGWVSAGLFDPGWTCRVEQGHFGHRARKATWLYAARVELPRLPWGASTARAWVSWCGNHTRGQVVERMGKRERSATPPAFRELLLGIARSAQPACSAGTSTPRRGP